MRIFLIVSTVNISSCAPRSDDQSESFVEGGSVFDADYPSRWVIFACRFTHLAQMALFAVNTGCRDGEICNLQWGWEQQVPELDTSVFMIPGNAVKNGDDRLVVLNDIALSVVNDLRGKT
jgi:integrase